MPPGRLLLLSDRDLTADALECIREIGLEVEQSRELLVGLGQAIRTKPDLILVDYQTFPSMVTELCQTFRATTETGTIPIVIFGGGENPPACMAAFESGADDWLTEPLTNRKSLLQLRAKLRHLKGPEPANTLVYADLQLDLQSFKVRRNGTAVTLRALELKLLRHFMENPTIVFSRRQLLETVWMNPGLEEGAVTALVKRLRETLSPLGGTHRIRTVHSVGYTFDADVRA